MDKEQFEEIIELIKGYITKLKVDAIVNAANISLLGGGGVDGVIHTVGPVWRGGDNDEEQLLSNCYISSLRAAVEDKVETIGFPNVSTGVYRFPKELAAKIALEEVAKFLSTNDTIKK